MIDYSKLPDYMQEPARCYIEEGRPTGSFLRALFSNDLMETFGRADDTNRAMIFEWVRFVHNEAPSGCHGSPQMVKAWTERGGLRGKVA